MQIYNHNAQPTRNFMNSKVIRMEKMQQYSKQIEQLDEIAYYKKIHQKNLEKKYIYMCVYKIF